MQVVYAAHLPLPSASAGDDPVDIALGAVLDWISRRFRVQLSPLAAGHATVEGVSVEWLSLTGLAGRLFSVWVDQTDQYDKSWQWRTYIDVGVENDSAWVRIRVNLYSSIEGLLINPQVQAGRPGLVRDLVRLLNIEIDGLPLDSKMDVGATQFGSYLALLTDPNRRLPIVTLSTEDTGDTFLDAERLADRIMGLAHVVVIDRAAAYDVTRNIGKSLSCYLGAVRIYWPHFSASDDPYYHRLYLGGALAFLGVKGLEDELFSVLGRLAGLSLDQPSLRRILLIAQRREELNEKVDERAQALARLEIAKSNISSISKQEFADFAADYEKMEARVTELEQEAVDAQVEILELREDRDLARIQMSQVWREINVRPDAAPQVAKVEEPPGSVLQAVDRASLEASSTVYLPEAFSSAGDSEFSDPSRALAFLRTIDEIASEWQQDSLPAGPHEAFRERVSAYRSGIGQKASTQFRGDYERDYEGSRILLEPHIARGTGPVSSILRIYMYFDPERRKIVVGHVGRKLRDASNRN